MPEASPLDWPPGYPRTKPRNRKRWSGSLTDAEARDSLYQELERTGGASIVISTNLQTYERGGREVPYASQPIPDDPGVAAYFQLEDPNGSCEPRVLCCDAWKTPAGNMRAIAITVRDLRRIEKRGVSDFLRRAFTGFKQLPEAERSFGNGTVNAAWWDVLGVSRDASEDEIRRAYRHHAKRKHPDQGGTQREWHELRAAYEQALSHV